MASDEQFECLRPDPSGPWVIASDTGFRLYRPQMPFQPGLAEQVPLASCPEVTRQLLAGCLVAAWQAMRPAPSGTEPDASTEDGTLPPPSLWRVLHELCGSYRTTHATPPVLRRARDRLRDAGDAELADYAEQKACEETGHDRLALRDLAALGLPAQAFVDLHRPRRSVALVALFERLCEGPRPAAVFGYAYVLERMALLTGQDSIDRVQSLVRPHIDITRCMRVHSSVGSDAAHVAELAERLAPAGPEDRRAIAGAVWRTASIMADPALDDFDPDVVRNAASRLGWRPDDVIASVPVSA